LTSIRQRTETVSSIRQQQEAAVQNLKDQVAILLQKGLQNMVTSGAQLSTDTVDSLLQATRKTLTNLGFKDVSLDQLTVSYTEETGKVEVKYEC